MSAVVWTELQEFALFIQATLDAGETSLTPEEVLDSWRLEHPTEEQFEENVRAIQLALDEMNEGERGIEAAEYIKLLRERLGVRRANRADGARIPRSATRTSQAIITGSANPPLHPRDQRDSQETEIPVSIP
jgi:hypothetical protein